MVTMRTRFRRKLVRSKVWYEHKTDHERMGRLLEKGYKVLQAGGEGVARLCVWGLRCGRWVGIWR